VTDPKFPLFDTWAIRRTRLKHNWFERLPDLVRAGGGPVPALLREWPEKAPQLRRWFEDSEAALSPQQVIDLPLFQAWPDDFRARVARDLHERFVARSGIRCLCQELGQLLDNLEKMIRPRFAGPDARLSEADSEPLGRALEEMCRRLAELPTSVTWPGPPLPERGGTAKLPRILVIDDKYGRPDLLAKERKLNEPMQAAIRKTSEERRAFCNKFRLYDTASAEGDREHCIAEVFFSAGQTWSAREGLRNSLPAIQRAIGGKQEQNSWALVLLDVSFNKGQLNALGDGQDEDEFGLDEVLSWLRERYPDLPVIIVTQLSRREIVQRMKRLGVRYLQRREADVRALLRNLFEIGRATPAQLRNALGLTDLVAEDRRTLDVFLHAFEAALDPQEATVLIRGESGTGKEEVANYIHAHSLRSDRQFVSKNCGNLAPERAEAELFGYYRNAFTGARSRDTEGLFHQANGGTLFLDEIGDLANEVQTKLLRTLNSASPAERDIEPAGNSWQGSRLPIQVNVRVLCATDQKAERLRPAFFRRIAATEISIPPLRERLDDIVPLAVCFLKTRLGVPGMMLREDAQECLRSFPYRNNAGELESILREAIKGKGGRNLLDREDIERAYNFLYADREEESPLPLLPVASVAGAKATDLSSAVQVVLEAIASPEGFDGLTQGQRKEIDRGLRGRVIEVVAILLEWGLFSSDNVNDLARYLTARPMRTPRESQDIVKRFFALHKEVLERVQQSPHLEKHALAKKLLAARHADGRKKGQRPPS
jgi:DNA-binding NtrC family response regulator